LKMRIATLSLTILCLALSVPAFADIYNDGPTNGTANAFFIDGPGGPFGQSISDGFIAASSGTGTEVFFAEWVFAGTTPTGVGYSIGTNNFQLPITNPATGFGASLLCTNGQPFNGGLCGGGFGYDLYLSHFDIGGGGFSFTAGNTYWLTLTDATDSGRTGFNAWDLNSGPATCLFESGGIVQGGGNGCGAGGESFTIATGGGTTPEPSSILLFGSGILGLAGVLRRKLIR
jgi:PEP-CTERM motif